MTFWKNKLIEIVTSPVVWGKDRGVNMRSPEHVEINEAVHYDTRMVAT